MYRLHIPSGQPDPPLEPFDSAPKKESKLSASERVREALLPFDTYLFILGFLLCFSIVFYSIGMALISLGYWFLWRDKSMGKFTAVFALLTIPLLALYHDFFR